MIDIFTWLVFTTLAGPDLADGSWQHYGANQGGQRHSPHIQINPANVTDIELAWQFRSGERQDGARFRATPLFADGRVFFSTGKNLVHALDGATGNTLWTFDPKLDWDMSYSERYTSRGISYWSAQERGESVCSARIVLGTLDARLISLDATSGKPCPSFGRKGTVDLSTGIARYRHGEYSVTTPPLVVGDQIIVGSSIGDNGAVELEPGTVRSFDALTGDLNWSWDPIPREDDDPGADSWRGKLAQTTGGGNVWSAMSADIDLGLVFLPTTSPSPDFFGGERLGHNRYANSVVALDLKTGEPRWDFQTTHHDLWDHDLASQPVFANVGNTPAIIQATKMGLVFVLDRATGKPIFEVSEVTAPKSDVPGEESAPTQPFPSAPPALHPVTIDREHDLLVIDDDHDAYCRQELDSVRYEGIYTPPSLRGTLLYPGNFGGTNWGSVTVDQARGLAIMAVNRLPTVVRLIPREDFHSVRQEMSGDPRGIQFTEQSGAPFGMMRYTLLNPANGAPCLKGPWGELVAISLADGSVQWRTPIGREMRLDPLGDFSEYGSLLVGGAITTESGLTIIGSRGDRMLHVLDTATGEPLHSIALPAGSRATPMSYRYQGVQYIIIAAGADSPDGKPGDYMLAYALPDLEAVAGK